MTEAAAGRKFKVNDRVKRAGVSGCYGTVKAVRAETINVTSHADEKDKNLMVNVQWDNGTLSYFSPSALEPVKE